MKGVHLMFDAGSHLLLQPKHLAIVGIVAGPMLVDGCYQRLFGSRDKIPDDIAGGWWTDVVVVAPRQINGTGNAASKIHHVVVSHRFNLLGSEHVVQTVEMGIASGAVVEITCHIREGRVVGYACCHTRVESCRNE